MSRKRANGEEQDTDVAAAASKRQRVALPPPTLAPSHAAAKKTTSMVAARKGQSAAPPGSRTTRKEANDTKKSRKRGREPSPVTTPRQKRFKDALPPTPQETPTRGTSRLLDRLNLAAEKLQDLPEPKTTAYISPPVTPHGRKGVNAAAQALPSKLADELHLFSALLNAHSLFLAHNGAGTSLGMQELLSRVTMSWRRRAVTTGDIRRLLGVLGEEHGHLEILDHGEGRLCVGLRGEEIGHNAGINQTLADVFERNLRKRWLRWNVSTSAESADLDAFVSSLPLSPIVRSEIAIDSSKSTKGAQRLATIRATALQAKTEQRKPLEVVKAESKSAVGLASRGTNLIDRIMAKQEAASTRGNGPSKEEIERRAALDRVDEVVLVLGFLAGGRPRASFSMQMIVQHLQNSMRNPIARDEAERCIGLLASDVAPRFINVVRSGSLHGVVVTKLGRPSASDLKDRVARAKAS